MASVLQHSVVTFAILFALDGCIATSGMGGRPALGFNNCNIQCCNETMPSAAFVKRTAEQLVGLGLKDAGYEYVVSPWSIWTCVQMCIYVRGCLLTTAVYLPGRTWMTAGISSSELTGEQGLKYQIR